MVIEAERVTKTFRKGGWLTPSRAMQAVDDVNFRVKKGQVVGVLGPNGCGKSTLIRMIGCLLLPDSGKLEVSGFDVVRKPDKVKWMINRVSVEASFFKKLTPMENLLYAGRLYGLSADEVNTRARKMLGSLHFPKEKLDEPLEELSRGLQQKISICRGFLSRPEILLLDEPTTGLDPGSKQDVTKFVRSYLKETGASVVLTSHDMKEVECLCEYVYLMHRGKVIAQGTPSELKDRIRDGQVYELGASDCESLLWDVQSLNGVRKAYMSDDSLRFHAEDIDALVEDVLVLVRQHGLAFRYLREVVPTLEDVFIQLTGASLEEEDENEI